MGRQIKPDDDDGGRREAHYLLIFHNNITISIKGLQTTRIGHIEYMELKDFVAQTLKEIIDGVTEAQEYHQQKGGDVVGNVRFRTDQGNNQIWDAATNQPAQMIDFDVAVTTTEGNEKSGGVGVFVGSVGIGTKGKIDEKNTATSRIKFSVPIFLPSNQKKRQSSTTRKKTKSWRVQ